MDRLWGPYLAERAWGTVREDYSVDGDAWRYVTHDRARSHAYRWSEDGLAGICDIEQRLCFAFAFWNGRDPILKERIFGLDGTEGNHGEDAKELWWYLDALPDASWLRWRYIYPQGEFPYTQLVAENGRRSRNEPEFELLDTGAIEAGAWVIDVTYAKAAADDICIHLAAHNHSASESTLTVLPTLWFRNTWSWSTAAGKPALRFEDGAIVASHDELGSYVLTTDDGAEALFCENETGSRFPKDGIGDHVVHSAATVNPEQIGTKAAFVHRLTVAPGERAELGLRLAPDARPFDRRTISARRADADTFYAQFDAEADSAVVLRQALAGMIWSQQFFNYDVERWLEGDDETAPPPPARQSGRNASWRHVDSADVISMPDTWEYPWFAAWDLAFHTLPLALVDTELAKQQLLLLFGERFLHPSGQVPAYEWNFSDANPPVHAAAALRVFELDGSRDIEFLERMLHKLLLNFAWWVDRKDRNGNDIFSGGFLGLDNISPIDRSVLPPGETLDQADATGWMARYCLDLLRISLVLAEHDPVYEDLAIAFAEHFATIAGAIDELWNEDDGFYYDRLLLPDGSSTSLRVHSAVGLIPLLAISTIELDQLERFPRLAQALERFERAHPHLAAPIARDETGRRVLSLLPRDRLQRVAARIFAEAEFLSPFGLRSLSRLHEREPLEIAVAGVSLRVDYEPAESTTALYGGNSNWRGPIWFPLNYLAIEGLRGYGHALGDGLTVELPTGSGNRVTLSEAADDLTRRLVSIFTRDAAGHRPVDGSYAGLPDHPLFREGIPYHEYFHADTGAGLGASHQTGWTGLVALLLARR
ncbi:MAG: MGH1-like glycoside hydrolase domain-containing protein [Gaiellaceae bacterium]